jgi:hypothetical protein
VSESDEHGMSLEDFFRKVVEASQETEDRPDLTQAQAAIHVAIVAEYTALCERALIVDALRSQPDVTLATAGRGWALHYLAARMANVLHKHTQEPLESQEYAAQKLEHDAACTRWAARLADALGRAESVDKALERLNDDG